MTVLLLLFQFGFPLFLFLHLLLWLGLPKLCWIKVARVDHPCLVPDLRGNAFSFSLLSMMLAVGLSHMAFIMLRYVPSRSTFWRVYIHKWVLNFVKSFFCIYWDDHMLYILQLVDVVHHTDWCADTEKFLRPWDKSHLIMVYDPFTVLLDSVC